MIPANKLSNNSESPNSNDYRSFDQFLSVLDQINEERGIVTKKTESKKKNNIDTDELEKFFLFMSTLNPTEIKVLNETQLDSSKTITDQPIFFSNEFKNYLKPNQRLDICNLRIMSLRRNKILKDPMGRIEMENLNYDALYSKNSQNTLTDIKNYFITHKIIKNWETTKTKSNKNQFNKPVNAINMDETNNENTEKTTNEKEFFKSEDIFNNNHMPIKEMESGEEAHKTTSNHVTEKNESLKEDFIEKKSNKATHRDNKESKESKINYFI